ncbi:transcription initiation factor TFIID subunit 11 [Clonorchis sinensis]|uniref:Transcription initiation factor TFIID subunit 11 n=2 Tax=Clonorchis sinensis TaxID=79923 RepID=A0A8T1M703_CLOSI|nr:transcription initiation factor TFIID subunit 11 [Clonorchis sinensis]GAA55178.1 transcription initiation factor TFIID subunit 11 [Clonorchis sinensis]
MSEAASLTEQESLFHGSEFSSIQDNTNIIPSESLVADDPVPSAFAPDVDDKLGPAKRPKLSPTESSSLTVAEDVLPPTPSQIGPDTIVKTDQLLLVPSDEPEELACSSQEAPTEELEEQDTLEEEEEDEEEDDEEEDVSTVLGEDDADSVVTRLISPALEQEREERKKEDRKLLALLAHFDEEQLNRFETFRRATFAKASVRRLIQSVASCAVSQNVVIAIAGMTKVYIGEIVEEALDYKERLGESGPLKPKHIREAYRLLNASQSSCSALTENPLC